MTTGSSSSSLKPLLASAHLLLNVISLLDILYKKVDKTVLVVEYLYKQLFGCWTVCLGHLLADHAVHGVELGVALDLPGGEVGQGLLQDYAAFLVPLLVGGELLRSRGDEPPGESCQEVPMGK